jgi:hypothetical protein
MSIRNFCNRGNKDNNGSICNCGNKGKDGKQKISGNVSNHYNRGKNITMAAFVTKTTMMVTLLNRVHAVMKISRSTCEVPATLIGFNQN